MIFVVISLTCVIWLSQSLRFVDLIVNQGLPIATFLRLTVMLMPTWLSIVLPIAAFAGTLFVYNRMTNDREMVVMSAAGLSPLRLARPALLIGVVTTLLCYLMTLYLVPMSYRGFKELQFKIRHNFDHVILKEGEFRSIGNDLTVYIRARQGEGVLSGIVVHDQRDKQKPITLIAERGALVTGPEGPRVVMGNGSRQEHDKVADRINILYFAQYSIDLGGIKEVIKRTTRDKNELFVDDLLKGEQARNDKDRNEYVAEAHQRLTTPLLGLTLTAVGLAVLLGGQFSRRGQAWRILLAVSLAALVEAAVLGSKHFAAKSPSMIPVIWISVSLPFFAALLTLARTRLKRGTPAPAMGA